MWDYLNHIELYQAKPNLPLGFKQVGEVFVWDSPIDSELTCPTGLKIMARLTAPLSNRNKVE